MRTLLLLCFALICSVEHCVSGEGYGDQVVEPPASDFDFSELRLEEGDPNEIEEELQQQTLVNVEFYSSGDGEKPQNCEQASKNTDQFVDKVLEEIKPKLPEPALLPRRFGRFRLFNGTLFGLSSVKRIGPAMTRCSDTSFSFLVPVGFRHLNGGYLWEWDTSLRPLKGAVGLSISRLQADVLYTRTQTPSGVNATVDQLTIRRLDGVDISVDGLGPLNRFASRLTNFMVRIFRHGVSRMLEGPVRRAMNQELEDVKKYEQYYFF